MHLRPSYRQKCFNAREKMICLETQHFSINRTLLLIVGLWPYQRSSLVRFQLILLFGILITFIVFQFTAFMTLQCTAELVLKILSSAFFLICLAIKYNSFWINSDIVRSTLEYLQDMCNGLKNDNEIAIIEKYGNRAKRYTVAIILIGICAEIAFTFILIWPCIRHVTRSTNKSRLDPIYIVTEYFIDKKKYVYLIILHNFVAFYIGGIAMIATGSTLLAYLHHICGMFSIASYRIEQAMTIDVLQKNSLKKHKKNYKEIYKGIIYAVEIHRKAMEFTEFLISNFEGSFFILILFGVMCLSLNLFRALTFSENIEQLMLSFIIIIILYVYLFLSNYMAQVVTEHNEYVFATVYNTQWYLTPIYMQKMMLFLLQRRMKAFNVMLGGIFVASMESATSLASTSISCFTVLYSTR